VSPRFETIFPWLIVWEGTKYEDDPDDPGGATKFGIDQRSHPSERIKDLTLDRAKEIYWSEYWQRNRCEQMARPIGEVYFNACVNCGPGRASKLLQRGRTASAFLDAQEDFYRGLAAARPSSQKYLRGWGNRVADLRKFLLL